MNAYAELCGRNDEFHRQQLLRLLPPLDRVFLKDFYDKQSEAMEKAKQKSRAKSPRRT